MPPSVFVAPPRLDIGKPKSNEDWLLSTLPTLCGGGGATTFPGPGESEPVLCGTEGGMAAKAEVPPSSPSSRSLRSRLTKGGKTAKFDALACARLLSSANVPAGLCGGREAVATGLVSPRLTVSEALRELCGKEVRE